MNPYTIIILCALGLSYLLEVVSQYLNLKSLTPNIPLEFRGVYDPEKYQRSQEYSRARTKLQLIESTFDLCLLLVFWFTGGFNSLDLIVRSWNLHPILTGVLYIGILVIAKELLSLPFSIYGTFVIEEKFGFNKTSVRTFILDRIKMLALGSLLGGGLLAGILAFFQFSGSIAWIYCWALTSGFILIMQYIAPTWIMPLFNKFTPLKEGELKKQILSYAESIRFPIQDVLVMDGSKRSSKSNAFFTGFGKNKRIVLLDTLLENHSVPELIAVLAHEMGHYIRGHIVQGILLNIIHWGIVFFLLSLFLDNKQLFDAFYMEHISVYAGLVFFGLLYSPISLILSILINMLSRHHEFEADRFASQTIHEPESMVMALKNLSLTNLSNLTPHAFHVFLTYSHPPVLQRIHAIREFEKKSIQTASSSDAFL